MEKNNIKKPKDDMEYIVSIEVIKKQSLMNYSFNSEKTFLKIYTGMPAMVKPLRTMLEKGVNISGLGMRRFLTYESNVLFVLRCMIDSDIVGSNWVELPAHKYKVRKEAEKTSYAQLEIDVSFEEVISHSSDDPNWLKIAPLRIMSFDIECAGREGHFPSANEDPIIQIANYVTIQGEKEPFIKNIFLLKSCANIVGADIHSYTHEDEMLRQWRNFVINVDPDILTGYNIINFDLPYLLNRAKALKVGNFAFLGRLANKKSQMRNQTFSSRAYGTRENKDINIEGRVQLDVMQVVQRDHKLSSYTLNNVSSHFLGEQKEEVHHSIISDLQNGDDETRRRLAVYCLKDAYLPQRLLDKLMIVINYIEMARVTGIPLKFILQRGQQIKVISQLLRKARNEGFLMPVPPSAERPAASDTYEGATVLDAKTGFYDTPITTLDFASLYPSIMIAHNLCYTTLVREQDAAKLKEDDYIKTPTGDIFVKPHIYRGLLPSILESLLSARKKAKDDLKNAKTPLEKAVLDGRQLALKVSANSVYGFTGATIGMLPCLAISASVTSFGRDMIAHSANFVTKHYTTRNGYPYNAEVIYGDTDSIMIKFGISDMKEVMEMGREAAALVSKEFINPIRLEFEKVYYPFLLLAKKRYAGLYWTKPDKHDRMDAKGIVTVRRDNCALVRNVISTCLHLILEQKSVQGAMNYARNVISDLLMNRMDISMLVITKAISRKEEDYTAKQAHVELAKRMRKRDSATAPRVGDRVPYVVIEAHSKARAYEKSEDPIYVLENNLPIDAKFYLEKALKKPLLQIFTPIMDKPEELFTGEHTRSISKQTPKSGGIMKFAQKKATCLNCKTVLTKGVDGPTLCSSCQHKEAEIYQSLINKRNHYENIYSRVWTHCQRCQGSLHQDVLCTNKDCPVFYMRKKVQTDLLSTENTLADFVKVVGDW
jgi:DNA polymerase delta subunit 1